MKAFLALCLALLVSAHTFAFDAWVKPIARATPIVHLMQGTNEQHTSPDTCSVIMVAPGRAVTALHCVAETIHENDEYDSTYRLYVDDREASLLSYQHIAFDGIALLSFEQRASDVIATFNARPLKIGQDIAVIGFAYGFSQIMAQVGHVQLPIQDENKFLCMDMSIYPGDSGAAIIDSHGQVVGMNAAIYTRQDHHESHFGVAMTAQMILDFLKTQR